MNLGTNASIWFDACHSIEIRLESTELERPRTPAYLFHSSYNSVISRTFSICPAFLIYPLLPLACSFLLCLKRNHLFTNYIKLTVNIYGHIKNQRVLSFSSLFVYFHRLSHFIHICCFFSSSSFIELCDMQLEKLHKTFNGTVTRKFQRKFKCRYCDCLNSIFVV